MNNHTFIKLILVNVLVFIILVISFFLVEDTDNVLEVGIGFYSMEVGILLGQKMYKGKEK